MTVAKFRLNSQSMDRADSPISQSSPVSDEGLHQVIWKASPLALFLPGLVVAAGYGALLLALFFSGKGEGALARVCLLVLVIVVPLLFAHAGLRLSTTRLTLHAARLEAHPGFPARDPEIIPYAAVTGVSLRRGLSGWITGAGSLVIERDNGMPVVVSGLSNPDAAMAGLTACREAVELTGVTAG